LLANVPQCDLNRNPKATSQTSGDNFRRNLYKYSPMKVYLIKYTILKIYMSIGVISVLTCDAVYDVTLRHMMQQQQQQQQVLWMTSTERRL